MLKALEERIIKEKDLEKAKVLQKFFKTGKGEYGEGDVFYGITVPKIRVIAKEFKDIGFNEIQELISSKVHENRMLGLLILIEKFKKSQDKEKIVEFYLNNTKNINNWDLVDLSAPNIIGAYLSDKDKNILNKLSRSENLWERRIAIVSCLYFIKNNEFSDTLKISEILLKDKHDLIHKSVGWMLREVGKKNQEILIEFLKKNYKNMPRTMLRYSIEKFPLEKRMKYLKGLI